MLCNVLKNDNGIALVNIYPMSLNLIIQMTYRYLDKSKHVIEPTDFRLVWYIIIINQIKLTITSITGNERRDIQVLGT